MGPTLFQAYINDTLFQKQPAYKDPRINSKVCKQLSSSTALPKIKCGKLEKHRFGETKDLQNFFERGKLIIIKRITYLDETTHFLLLNQSKALKWLRTFAWFSL